MEKLYFPEKESKDFRYQLISMDQSISCETGVWWNSLFLWLWGELKVKIVESRYYVSSNWGNIHITQVYGKTYDDELIPELCTTIKVSSKDCLYIHVNIKVNAPITTSLSMMWTFVAWQSFVIIYPTHRGYTSTEKFAIFCCGSLL